MRIPTYQSGAAPTSEAPGRSFSARMSAQPFVAEAQAKGGVIAEAANQIGQFAQMRYKAARETQINEKVLSAEEALRERARDLSNTPTGQLGSVFNEGGKPEEGTWAKSTAETLSTLLSDVKDREARRILTDRFNQMELSERFRLRGVIDQKIEAANAAARAARMRAGESALATANDLGSVDLAMQGIGIDSMRLAQLGLGDPNALKRQEYSMLYGGIKANVNGYLTRQDIPSQAAENLRKALREDDPTLAGDAQVQYALLKKLPIDAQASILSGATSAANFIDAPTEQEKRDTRIGKEIATSAGQTIKSFTADIQRGQTLPEGSIEQLEATVAAAGQFVDPDVRVELEQGIGDLKFINSLASDLKSISSPNVIGDMIRRLEAGNQFDGPGIQDREQLGLEYLRGYKRNMEDGLAKDPVSYASSVGAIEISPVDLSPEAIQSGVAGASVAQRISDATYIRGQYEISGPMKLLTQDEVSRYAPMLSSGNAVQKMSAIAAVNALFKQHAPDVFAQLSEKQPIYSHAAGLMQDGRFAQAEIIMKGMDRIDAGFKPFEGADASEAKSQFDELSGAALSMLPAKIGSELRKNVYDAAQAYYAEVIARRPDKSFDEDLWNESVQAASGFDKETGRGGIQEVRGVPTLLPPIYTPDDVEEALSKARKIDFDYIGLADGPIDESLAEAIKDDDDYRLQALGKRNGRIVYGVAYGEFGDALYGLASDENGSLLSFTAEDLLSSVASPNPAMLHAVTGKPQSDLLAETEAYLSGAQTGGK